ncbi:unnamed protein product [Lactuca virosa]|uniref:Uncharacterized protein n=1 Tax=Lactuca virosa TaxID=75947 RepID=A0AAU9MLR9_9ASTR|nr:unnamed protein product [Lactuca virosa]
MAVVVTTRDNYWSRKTHDCYWIVGISAKSIKECVQWRLPQPDVNPFYGQEAKICYSDVSRRIVLVHTDYRNHHEPRVRRQYTPSILKK